MCNPVKEKDEDGDMVAETTEVNVVDEKKNIGKITIDLGAVENVLRRNYLPEIPSAVFSWITARSLIHRS